MNHVMNRIVFAALIGTGAWWTTAAALAAEASIVLVQSMSDFRPGGTPRWGMGPGPAQPSEPSPGSRSDLPTGGRSRDLGPTMNLRSDTTSSVLGTQRPGGWELDTGLGRYDADLTKRGIDGTLGR